MSQKFHFTAVIEDAGGGGGVVCQIHAPERNRALDRRGETGIDAPASHRAGDQRSQSRASVGADMNIILWIVQAILAIKLTTVTLTHGLQPNKPTIQEAGRQMGRAAKPLLVVIAAWTLLGTLGLILPGLLGWAAWDHAGDCCSHGTQPAGLVDFSRSLPPEKPKIFVSLVLFAFAVFSWPQGAGCSYLLNNAGETRTSPMVKSSTAWARNTTWRSRR